MMFVYVIARLERDIEAKDKVLDDLDLMADSIRIGGFNEPIGDSGRAMVRLIVDIEKCVMGERQTLDAALSVYKHQRDFRPGVS